MSKTADRFLCIVHTHCYACSLEIKDLVIGFFSVFTGKFHSEFTFSRNDDIGSAVLITKSVTTNNDGSCPVTNETGNIFADNRFAENSTIKNITDSTIWRLPHLFKVKFLNTCLIGSYSSAFDADLVFFNGLGGINSHLVVGLITVLDTKVVVFNIHVQVRKDQLVFNKFPDDPRHLVPIQLYNRVSYFYLAHCSVFMILKIPHKFIKASANTN